MRVSRCFPAAVFAASLSLLAVSTVNGDTYTFTHYAGSIGGGGTADGEASVARFRHPSGIALGADGTLYVTDETTYTVRAVSIATGSTSTFAGVADERTSMDGRRGEARFVDPIGLDADADGNLYVCDAAAETIRRITPGGTVSTWAGHAYTSGSTDGARTAARFNDPYDLAFDSHGNMFVADYGNHTIRKITPAGTVSTFAGSAGLSGSADGVGGAARFNHPTSVAVDAADKVYVTDFDNHTIRMITDEGEVTTIAGLAGSHGSADGIGSTARFWMPAGIAVSGDGSLYVADCNNQTIRRIVYMAGSFIVSTFAGHAGVAGWTDATGDNALFYGPWALVVDDGDGSIYVADSANHAVRKVTSARVVSTLAGRGNFGGYVNANGTAARFYRPSDVAVDSSGVLFVADTEVNVIRKISGPLAAVTLYAGSPGIQGAADGNGPAAQFASPSGVAVDSAGVVYVADRSNHTIRRIATDREVTTLAGAGVAGSTDGTGGDARFNQPRDVASDGTDVYVADTGNHTIRKVTPEGVVTTLAGHAGESGSADGTALARFNAPEALAADGEGNVYVADTGNHTIRQVTPAGLVSTIAGSAGVLGSSDGTGSAARFFLPRGIAVEERSGSIYLFVTQLNNIVRMIAPGGVVTTIGGGSQVEGGISDGTAGVSRFNTPLGLAVHTDGTLYIADSLNNCIRRGAAAIDTIATIDDESAAVGALRQLTASPTATTHSWAIVRRPAGSASGLSSSAAANPTFTPDIPDVYRFRLTAASATARSVTEVDLTAECPVITVTPATAPDAEIAQAYTQTFVAGGGIPPYTFESYWGAVPPGLSLSVGGTLSGTPTAVGTYTFALRARDYYGCALERDYTIQVRALQPPATMNAVATDATHVALNWSASAGATGYRVYRGTSTSSFVLIATVPAVSHIDATASANTSYLYRVRAYDGSGHESADSVADHATTVVFTDPVLLAGAKVKASHITQLRAAVNAMRALAGLPLIGYLPPALGPGDAIRSTHVTDLRAALTAARSILGLSTSYTDPGLGAGSPIRAVHINDLRDGVE